MQVAEGACYLLQQWPWKETSSNKTSVGPLSAKAMLRAAHCARSGTELSEEGSISNLASVAAVTFNPVSQWEKHQKVDR